MMVEDLYKVILERKAAGHVEGSYTCYLFEKGLDKILKKVGEESAETIIAAKNGEKTELVGEICDLAFHVLVMAAELGIDLSDITAELDARASKIGNLKQLKNTNHNT